MTHKEFTESEEIREQMLRALEADLIGPFDLDNFTAPEVLELPPSRWYLTGFLVPDQGRDDEEDPTDEEEMGAGNDVGEFDEPNNGIEPEPKQKKYLPASMGLSVLLPASGGADEITVRIRYADYERSIAEGGEGVDWIRFARLPDPISIPLDEATLKAGVEIPESGGIRIVGQIKAAQGHELPAGTRVLALFVVNNREPVLSGPNRAEQYIFQVSMQLEYAPGFVPRSNRRGETMAEDWDELVSDIQFRNRFEYGVGHGVSVLVPGGQPHENKITVLRTTWLPRATVPVVKTRTDERVKTSMEFLAELADGAAVQAALAPLPGAYEAWLEEQSRIDLESDERKNTRKEIVKKAREAAERIRAGIEILSEEPEALEAFRLMNRAMAMAARQRNKEMTPSWRLFQIAFILLNIRGTFSPEHADRKIVDLIFFPTGGGKNRSLSGCDWLHSDSASSARAKPTGRRIGNCGHFALHSAPPDSGSAGPGGHSDLRS